MEVFIRCRVSKVGWRNELSPVGPVDYSMPGLEVGTVGYIVGQLHVLGGSTDYVLCAICPRTPNSNPRAVGNVNI